jgi:uncharacterized membrane protein YhaH (DUF805 family)
MILLEAIRSNLARLASFAGREAHRRFWYYAVSVLILTMAIMAALMLPQFTETFTRMQAFAAAHPDQATVSSGPGSYSITIHGDHPELMPDLGDMMDGVAISLLLAIVLLAAAVVRRLHDRNRTGWWGAMPLPFVALSMAIAPSVFAPGNPDLQLFATMFLSNLAYLVSLAWLVVLLGGPGDITANRFGPPPTA